MKITEYLIGLTLLLSANLSNAGWSPFYDITSNYFQPIGSSDQSIIITFNEAFHECGWNSGAEVQESIVGKDYFKTVSSVILSAIMAKKKVSILTSNEPSTYCAGKKAKILAIRLEN
jgi:hypothetical protein